MDSNRSGVGEYTYHVLENLFKIDYTNQYFLFYNSFSKISHNLPAWNYPNVKFVESRWPNKIFNFCQKFLKYPKLDKVCGGVDLFWLPNWHFVTLSDKCHLILTVHDLSHLRYPEFLSLKRRLWHRFLAIPKLLDRADKIIAVSKSTQHDLEDLLKIDSSKIQQIYSGVELAHSFSTIEIEMVKAKFGIDKDFIFSIGNLEPRKNVAEIITAYNLWRQKNPKLNIDLIIAGQPSWKYKAIYKLARESEFGSQIKFINYISQQEKHLLYSLAKVFVYPSFYEGFGIPPLEAMSHSCPVIASLNSSLSEVIGEAGILIDVVNVDDLAQAIKTTLTDSDLRASLIAKGLERVKQFNWAETAREVKNFLEK